MNTAILLQAQGQNPTFSVLMMVGMFAVMYFFMIRPQSKRAKEQKQFAEALGVGEYVITTAGIHGTVTRMFDDGTLQVEIGKGNFIKIERSAISMEMTAAYKKKNQPVAETSK